MGTKRRPCRVKNRGNRNSHRYTERNRSPYTCRFCLRCRFVFGIQRSRQTEIRGKTLVEGVGTVGVPDGGFHSRGSWTRGLNLPCVLHQFGSQVDSRLLDVDWWWESTVLGPHLQRPTFGTSQTLPNKGVVFD